MEDIDQAKPPVSALGELVAETDWQAIAPAAGSIGRFVYDPATELCELDATMRRITGLLDRIAAFPAADYIERIDDAHRPDVIARLGRTVADRVPFQAEYRFHRSPGDAIWLSGQGRIVDTPDGRPVLIGAVYDITELRQAQERAELMTQEMAHRMKNVFALMQGMFNMAARSSETKADLVESYTGRLRALASVNAMTFGSADRSVCVTDLVADILGPLVESDRISAKLDRIPLNGAAAQTVVLVLNELLTNAVKYGALRDEAGSVALSIAADDGDFVLTWDETATPPILEPTKTNGFGMRVLRSMTVATFSGAPRFEWREGGLLFSCRWGLDEFGPDDKVGAAAP